MKNSKQSSSWTPERLRALDEFITLIEAIPADPNVEQTVLTRDLADDSPEVR